MSWRAGILAACLTLPSVVSGPDDVSGYPLPQIHERQFFDEERLSLQPRSAEVSVPAESTEVTEVTEVTTHHEELDVLASEIEFSLADISRLQTGHTVQLYLPEHGELTMTLESVRQNNATTITRFKQADMVGTITQRGQRFHMTLPTSLDLYRIQGDANRTTLTSSNMLAQRMVNHEKDFRYVE